MHLFFLANLRMTGIIPVVMTLSLMFHVDLKAGIGVVKKIFGFDGSALRESMSVCMSAASSLPVFGFGVIGAEFHDGHIGTEIKSVAKRRLFHIGIVSLVQHRATAHPEVLHQVAVA